MVRNKLNNKLDIDDHQVILFIQIIMDFKVLFQFFIMTMTVFMTNTMTIFVTLLTMIASRNPHKETLMIMSNLFKFF